MKGLRRRGEKQNRIVTRPAEARNGESSSEGGRWKSDQAERPAFFHPPPPEKKGETAGNDRTGRVVDSGGRCRSATACVVALIGPTHGRLPSLRIGLRGSPTHPP